MSYTKPTKQVKVNNRKGTYEVHHGKAQYWPMDMNGNRLGREIEALIEKTNQHNLGENNGDS